MNRMICMNRVCLYFLVAAVSFLVLFATTVTAATHPWVATGDLNTPRSRTGLAFDAVTGHFFLAGGESNSGGRDLPIEEYDPVTGQWTDRVHLQVGVANTGAVFVNGFLYVPGGYDGTSGVSDLQRFDPSTNTVVLLAPMPAVNYAHGVTAHAGKIHVLGGNSDGLAGTTHYVYDIATDNWASLEPLAVAVQYPAAVSNGQNIYVMGGAISGADGKTVQMYVAGSDEWVPGPELQEDRTGAAAFVDSSMRINIVGGGWTSYLATTEVLEGGSWTYGAPLLTGARTTAVAFGNSLAVKAGGWNGSYVGAAEIQAIDMPVAAAAPVSVPVTTWRGILVLGSLIALFGLVARARA